MILDSSVGIVTGLWAEIPRECFLISGRGKRFLYCGQNVHTGPDVIPSSCSLGTKDATLGVKRPGREAGQSPLSNVDVKNE